MNYIIFLGLVAGLLTTLSSLPQIVRVVKLRETKDLSIWWCTTLFTGLLLWSIYGFLIQDIPLIVTNGVGSVLVFIILLLKIKFG
jgi:MtN3 and saliva related transmembrane protein